MPLSSDVIYLCFHSYFLQNLIRHTESPVKSAVAGTKTPALVKPCPTGAIFDSAENLRKLSALRADVSRRSGGNDASLLSCFFLRPESPPQTRPKAALNPSPGQGRCPAPKEATQRLTGANTGVIGAAALSAFSVPADARQRLLPWPVGAGGTDPPPVSMAAVCRAVSRFAFDHSLERWRYVPCG